VIATLARSIGSPVSLRAALDVGCGTGLSTRPLSKLARTVVGLDPSGCMLGEAAKAGGALYVQGRAEALPFGDAEFELVTIGCAFHWCETQAFLAEAARVLRGRGYLLIYDNAMLGDAAGSPLLDWLINEHWARLPRTPRQRNPDFDAFSHPSFDPLESRVVDRRVHMLRQDLVTYLTTQSGAVAAVESGERSLSELESFLRSGLSTLVPEEGTTCRFGGPLWLLRRRP
jgi:SAM-dependent methyltransferase